MTAEKQVLIIEAEKKVAEVKGKWRARIEEARNKRWIYLSLITGTAFVLGMAAIAIIIANVY